MSHVVTAPYVTARVKDDFGSDVVREFYAGGVLPKQTHSDDIDRLTRKGMIAEQGSAEADAASPVGKPVQFDSAGMPKADAPADSRKPAPKPGPKAQSADPKA